MKALLGQSVEQFGRAVERFPWQDKRAYGDWLAQTYFYVRHSTRLLAASAARFAHDERGIALHSRFAAHMGEEKRHEMLCVHDLKVLDLSLASFPEHPSTRLFYEPQYYKIEHQTPMALFGYILPLEAVGPVLGKRTLERIVTAHGEKCVSFLKLHAEDDVEHLDKALRMLDGLTPEERGVVEENVRQTTYAYVTLLDDIRRHLDTPQP